MHDNDDDKTDQRKPQLTCLQTLIERLADLPAARQLPHLFVATIDPVIRSWTDMALQIDLDGQDASVGTLHPTQSVRTILPIEVFEEQHGNVTVLTPKGQELAKDRKAFLESCVTLLRKHLEYSLLREHNHRIEGMINATRDLLSFVDTEYVYRYVNDAYSEIWGLDSPSIVGMTVPELMGEKTFQETVKPHLDECLEGRSVRYTATICPKGKEVIRDVQYEPYRGESGEILGVVVSSRDITDREHANAALIASEKRFRELAANIPGATFKYVLLPDGSDSIDYISPGCEDIWEVTREELAGDPAKLWSMIVSEDLEPTRQSVQRSAETMTKWEHDFRIVTPSDKLKYLHGQGMPRKLSDGSLQWDSIFLDISEQQVQRQQLEHAQKFKALAQITGGVAHDFNNLLTGILGFSTLIREVAQSDAHVDIEEYADLVIENAERGKNLIDQLLTFVRPTASQSQKKAIDLGETLTDVARFLTSAIPASIKISLHVDDRLSDACIDATQLSQVIMNLCINARDAISDVGTIEIRAGDRQIDQQECCLCHEQINGHWVAIDVIDDGPGIDLDIRSRIFDPFFTTKKVDKGTGLGLSVVAGIIRSHRGHILLDTGLGKGAKFRVLLQPASAKADREQSEPIPATHPRGNGEAILVVDDEPSVTNLMEKWLTRRNYEVFVENDSPAALEKLLANPEAFRLLITDQTMPDLRGLELARKVRTVTADLPIILCSGHSEDIDEETAAEHGVDAFLEKPFDLNSLLVTVARLIQAGP